MTDVKLTFAQTRALFSVCTYPPDPERGHSRSFKVLERLGLVYWGLRGWMPTKEGRAFRDSLRKPKEHL